MEKKDFLFLPEKWSRMVNESEEESRAQEVLCISPDHLLK